MQSSTNAAVVGLMVIIGVGLLAGVAVMLRGATWLQGGDYHVIAQFEDVTGITPGMSVTASGMRVGYVEKILPPEGQLTGLVGVKLRLDEVVVLTPDSTVTVIQADFMGEKYLDLQDLAGPAYSGLVIKEGEFIRGLNPGGLNEMITAQIGDANELLTETVNEVVGGLMLTLDATTRLMEGAAGVVESNEAAVAGTMSNFQAAAANMRALSANLQQASAAVSELATDPQHRDTMEQLSSNLLAISTNLAQTTDSINALAGDPQLGEDARATVAATRGSVEELQKLMASFGATMPGTLERVNTLLESTNSTMQSVTTAVQGVSGVIDSVGGAVTSVKGPGGGITSSFQMRLDMDNRIVSDDMTVRLTGEEKTTTRDMNALLGYGNIFAQFGYDGIGTDEGGVNALVGRGNANEGFSYKTGAYRGEVGTGVSYRFGKNSGVDGYMYDANDPKYNVYGRLPLTDNLGVMVGVEDATGDSKVAVGATTTF